MLTLYQLNHFRQSGYLILPSTLPEIVVRKLREAILADVESEAEPVVRDDEGRVIRLSALLGRDALFFDVAGSPVVTEPLSDLLGPNILMIKNRHNHATMNFQSDKHDDFHRDNVQWSRGLLTIIFYLEDTTVENGCTQIVPGTHLLPGLNRLHRLADTNWISQSGVLDQALHLPLRAGQMLAIDSMVFHRAGANSTDASRMSMTIGYQSVDELNDSEESARTLIAGERIYMGNDRKKS
ncbi:MAG: phytanoyl-CoA dioxygenase family protein [Candidatus Latescibacterota bacterium]|nr:phytanoyl-CoA dioxygenase family protein [Candidatus Latescibacterota bacterium]